MKYQLIVGNIGTVLDTDNEDEILNAFAEYYHQSIALSGRACGENVTWMSDGEPVFEYVGDIDTPSELWRPLYQIVDHGIDHAQYFRGCGTSYTEFDECVTGCGSSGLEALDDAMEQMAMSGCPHGRWVVIEACIDHEMKQHRAALEADSVEAHLRKHRELTEDDEVPEMCELYYYLSIRY
jgi:hypothetical protein